MSALAAPLETVGSPRTGSPLTLKLSNASPNAQAYLVAGWGANARPFKGGVLVPQPDYLLAQTTDATGAHELTFSWPDVPTAASGRIMYHRLPDAPPGESLLVQYWIRDPAGPRGWTCSNAVSLIEP